MSFKQDFQNFQYLLCLSLRKLNYIFNRNFSLPLKGIDYLKLTYWSPFVITTISWHERDNVTVRLI